MNKVYLLLGSNMGNSIAHITAAKRNLSENLGAIQRESGLYQTAAWGKTDQPDFLNQVIVVLTLLDAPACMKTILEIESEMGRKRTEKNAPRLIDIDILYFNKEIFNHPQLSIPHPAIPDRRFVLTPLNEIAPAFVHPVLQKTNHALLIQCTDQLDVKKI